MVPRTSRQGGSFSGAWKYYAHDKRTPEQQAQGQEVRSRERVGFVHTENLGGIEDDRAAIGLMIDTAARNERCEKPVYAFSLGWHPEETPSREAMIEAGREALAVLKMQDYQALMISHTDTAHPHLHVIVNRIHPETGKAINVYKDQEKLQAWALGYEREHGKVYCQAREFKALARQRAKEQDGARAPGRYVDNTIAECWTRSDSGRSFKTALEAKGWGLARGDRKEAVLMAVAPSGRAFAVLRELNKGLPKGQTIKGEAFDRQTADLKRDKLKSVKHVQFEMHKRRRVEEKHREWVFGNARYEAREEERKERRWKVFERWVRREQYRQESRQEREQEAQQDAVNARVHQAREDAAKAQQVRQQQQALRALDQRMKKGGLVYRLSGKAKQDKEDREIMQERLDRSRQSVEGWTDRERRRSEPELTALNMRHEAERAALEKKIEETRKVMEGRYGQPERVAQQRAEPGERQEHGRGGRTLGR
jgi:hypothetical protein